jgi:hypothetical protein
MKSNKFSKIGITLFAALTLFCGNLVAQDVITLTWQATANSNKFITIEDTKGQFTVDWGDGTPIETKASKGKQDTLNHTYATTGLFTVTIKSSNNCHFGIFYCDNQQVTELSFSNCKELMGIVCHKNQLTKLDLSETPNLAILFCYENQLTELDLSGQSGLFGLVCFDNLLTKLDLTGCSELSVIACFNNRLTNLDLSSCTELNVLACFGNQLPLSDLFVAHLMIDSKFHKMFGTQKNLLSQIAIVGEELFSEQSVFEGIFTDYIVTIDGVSAPKNHYAVIDGKLIFKVAGNYTVMMSNDAIVSNADLPTEVIITFTVVENDDTMPLSQQLVFSRTEPEFSQKFDNNIFSFRANTEPKSFQVYPNPTNGIVYIKTESETLPEVRLYSIKGKLLHQIRATEIDLSGYPSGVYFLSVDREIVKIVRN